MDYFPFMKECLREFGYPKIHSMDDPEITDIFSKANRQFLVSWMLKQMDEAYYDIVEHASRDELAELIHHNGFCYNSEKAEFMAGECDSTKQATQNTHHSKLQFDILYKMFKYLKKTSDAKKSDKPAKNLSLKEFQNSLQFDGNLFPMYGPKQSLSSAERVKKIEEYEKEIQHMKNLLGSACDSVRNEHFRDGMFKIKLEAAMRRLELGFPNFKRSVLNIIKHWDQANNYENGKFKDDCAKVLKYCNKNARVAHEYIECMSILLDFKHRNDGAKNAVGNNYESSVMMSQLAELCTEIIALKKNTQ